MSLAALLGGQPMHPGGLSVLGKAFPMQPDPAAGVAAQFGAPAPASMPQEPAAMQHMQQQRGHGFAGVLDRILNPTNALGQFGQALVAGNGSLADAMGYLMQRRASVDELAQKQQMADRQRQQEREDYIWQQQNKAPVRNDTVDDFNWYKSLSPEDRALYDQQHPVITMTPEGPVAVPRSMLGGASAPVSNSVPSGLKLGPVVDTIPGGGAGGGTGGFPVSGNRLDRVTIQAESAGNPNAVSPVGARGLWQVMPATARDPGFGIRPSNGTQQDTARVGSEYRRAMEKRYGGDLAKMWAAYNWGPGNLDNAIAKHGAGWLDHAPAETRNYVRRNLRAVRGS